MFIDTTDSIVRTIIIGTVTYIFLVFILRITGKRTLSKLNAFDFIITVALGSTVATILLSNEISLLEGLTALILLILLQLFITWVSVRVPWFRRLVTSKPVLVFQNGNYIEQHMKQARITKSEILQAARMQGIGSLEEVRAVVLETSGELSVLKTVATGRRSTMDPHGFTPVVPHVL
ncbi:MAG: DUF421 domain-containing protein [Patescibacteria group bacterium]